MSDTEIGITVAPNVLVTEPTGLQRWAPVFNFIIVEQRPNNGRRLRVVVADQLVAQFDLNELEAKHLHAFFRECQRRNARAFCLGVRGFTRLVIGQPLAFDALERFGGAFRILDAKARAVVVTEIELFEIAMQMRLADRVIDARNSALEDAE